jgi:DNA-binding transcriptional MerR regulator
MRAGSGACERRSSAPGIMGTMASTEQAGTNVSDLPGESGYTLDQLESLTGVPGRTIRFYRQSGLIEPARRVGRQAFYAPEQLGRVRFIAALRERGMGLDAVGRLLSDPGGEHQTFAVLLSIQDELLEPWIDDHSAVVDGDEVLRLLGSPHAQALADLEQAGVVHRSESGDGYEVPSLAVLELAAEMMSAGIEPEVSAAAWGAMQRRIAQLADELITIFAEHPDHGFAGNDTAADISNAFRQLRPLALRAVQVAFAHEIQRALGEYLALAASADSIVPHREAPRPPSA